MKSFGDLHASSLENILGATWGVGEKKKKKIIVPFGPLKNGLLHSRWDSI
jgi:hypothetical protein